MVALHGCLLVGCVAVPVDLRLTDEERAARAGGAEVVLTSLPSPEQPRSARGWRRAVTLMHTSGTTAAPKQVVLTHGNWLANALGSAVALGLDPAERWLCPMPLTHVGGLSIPIRSSIYATTAVVHGRFDTEPGAERSDGPGAADHARVARADDARRGCSTPGCRGRRRCAGCCSGAARSRARCWSGRPLRRPGCAELRDDRDVLADRHVRVAPAGSRGVDFEGEVVVRGPMVAASALDSDGRLFTGDLGTFDDRGRLVITGRKADTIVTGGENVAPVEVEDVLLAHPAVADAAVFARPDAGVGGGCRGVRGGARGGHGRARGAAGVLCRSGSRATRCPRRSSSSQGCHGARRASCCGASWPEPRSADEFRRPAWSTGTDAIEPPTGDPP